MSSEASQYKIILIKNINYLLCHHKQKLTDILLGARLL